MTMSALKAHPKVYWIWNHRRWCLENVPTGPGTLEGDPSFLGWKQAAWDKELYVVEKMLDADSRNCTVPFALIKWLELMGLCQSKHGIIGDMFWEVCLCHAQSCLSLHTLAVKSSRTFLISLHGTNGRRFLAHYGHKES